ncbi:hypothetical protein CI238_04180 [Colletotrichum incanum]|uniref:Uncharacterized protein n=1 Tax=Colletotrichum incanum TaxID=1573173 RepID=A0A167CJ27_COLIC|nr:hypothetical protein CI238_04180 [Colletotrichum incanum]
MTNANAEFFQSLRGTIMWLPRRDQISHHLDPNLELGAYNHPVVVMSKRPSMDGDVDIFLMTSFGGVGIAERHNRRWLLWHSFIPISPASHPDKATCLRLTKTSPMLKKESYINIRMWYTVSLAALRPYGPGDSSKPVLDEASVEELAELTLFVDLFDVNKPQSEPVAEPEAELEADIAICPTPSDGSESPETLANPELAFSPSRPTLTESPPSPEVSDTSGSPRPETETEAEAVMPESSGPALDRFAALLPEELREEVREKVSQLAEWPSRICAAVWDFCRRATT